MKLEHGLRYTCRDFPDILYTWVSRNESKDVYVFDGYSQYVDGRVEKTTYMSDGRNNTFSENPKDLVERYWGKIVEEDPSMLEIVPREGECICGYAGLHGGCRCGGK